MAVKRTFFWRELADAEAAIETASSKAMKSVMAVIDGI
jgi:hypothetical protein